MRSLYEPFRAPLQIYYPFPWVMLFPGVPWYPFTILLHVITSSVCCGQCVKEPIMSVCLFVSAHGGQSEKHKIHRIFIGQVAGRILTAP